MDEGSEPKHTPEPWRDGQTGDSIIASMPHGPFPHSAYDYYGGYLVCESLSASDRRRIIACVNACKGISTADLEALQAGANYALVLYKANSER